ncbi:MAG: RnfABCDGE type electron transport complex subunit D, partial [Acholeplasmataceae bacterium]|nr:RnfABCDGE type electron transport complex subunit D [Acholeplasmataceae bacterium]
LPFKTPLWVLILGAFFATFFGKLVFGGFGNNIFNPALVGYIFVTTAFTSQILGNYLNPSETIITGATPMATLGSDFAGGVPAILNQYPLWKIFVGLVPGALAETSALLCLLALAYLLIRKVINWRIPVIYLATVFVLTYIIGAFNGYATDLTYPLVYLFSGALMFGAVFMATEPVTSPRSPNGKIVYALFLGVLTVLFRYRSNMPEGVATSILIMNVFAVIIDRLAARLRVEPNKRKVVIQYAVIGLLALGIGAYGVSAAAPKKSVEAEIVYKTKVQDLESFDFLYTITVDDDEITVTTDQAYKIKKISNKAYDNAEYKDKFNEIIKKQKFADYIVSAEEGLDYLEVVVSAQAQYRITAVVRYDADYRMVAFNADISNETYDDEEYYKGWDPADGDPAVDTPNDILANQDDLDAVQPIPGATNTCVGMINAARAANRYRDYIIGSSELALIGKSQDFSDLNFRYYFRQNREKFIVTTDQDYEVLTDLESDVKEAVERLIAKNKFMGYIESVATEGENTVLVVKTKRPAGIDFVTSSITFTGGRITAFEADTEHEDYD